jgi:hypothetical protein
MSRRYRSTVFGFFVRWVVRFSLFLLALRGLEWLLTDALPSLVPVALATGAVLVAGWVMSHLAS